MIPRMLSVAIIAGGVYVGVELRECNCRGAVFQAQKPAA
jgi:hypothetical protein